MSFFAELKRRNVTRMAALYVVAAWLIMQAAQVLTSLLPVPDWTGPFVVTILALDLDPVRPPSYSNLSDAYLRAGR